MNITVSRLALILSIIYCKLRRALIVSESPDELSNAIKYAA